MTESTALNNCIDSIILALMVLFSALSIEGITVEVNQSRAAVYCGLCPLSLETALSKNTYVNATMHAWIDLTDDTCSWVIVSDTLEAPSNIDLEASKC